MHGISQGWWNKAGHQQSFVLTPVINPWLSLGLSTLWGTISISRVQCSYLLPNIHLTHWGRDKSCHFADDIFKLFFLNENVWILIKITLKFVSKGQINNNPAFDQAMAWRRPGDKPLSEAKTVSLLTHICVTRPQWDNENKCPWQLKKTQPKPRL